MARTHFPSTLPVSARLGTRAHLIACLLACLLFPLGGLASRPALAGENLDQVKAAYLFNILKFTSWPATTTNELEICVAGEMNETIRLLAEGIRGRALQGKQIRLRYVMTGNSEAQAHNLNSCTILYLSNLDRLQIENLLHEANGFPILTASDAVDFVNLQGGMVELAYSPADKKIQIIINPTKAQGVNIQFSSKLLQLVKISTP